MIVPAGGPRPLTAAGITKSQLEDWGERIGATVELPVFFAMRGDLGAGKSVLARSIARGAGVQDIMPSPTFNLVFRYEGTDGVEVVHMDLYRLERESDVWGLDWRDLVANHDIVLVEWPERAESLLPPVRWEIRLDADEPDAALRNVTAVPVGTVPVLPGFREP